MKILFYRYGSILEPAITECFRQAGLEVAEETTQISKKDIPASQIASSVSDLLAKDSFLFVFSVNFFPAVSDVCNIYRIPYVCWSVDCPVMELFSPSLAHPCNRVFLFDRAQYEQFRPQNPSGIFHLPLATDVAHWDKTISSATEQIRKPYRSDVSFVGSLYENKKEYRKHPGISEKTSGYIQGLIEAQLLVYGHNFIADALTEEVTGELETLCDIPYGPVRSYISDYLIGYEVACEERHRLLNLLSEQVSVDLYTNSNTGGISPGIRIHKGVKTLTEMPLVFHESKINLNLSVCPIRSGLPLRVFDICGCGGFLLTNYQEELAELYEPGTEAEFFTSAEELTDKACYYLAHEEQRKAIAQKGYERTLREHTIAHRIRTMMQHVMRTL